MGGVEVGVRGPNTWPTIPQHDAHGGGGLRILLKLGTYGFLIFHTIVS